MSYLFYSVLVCVSSWFSVSAQQCIYDNKLLVENGTHVVNQQFDSSRCTQSIALSLQSNKAIVIIFFAVKIDCNGSNLQLIDANHQSIDYCQSRRNERTFYFISTQSTYVSMYTTGTAYYTFSLLFSEQPILFTISTSFPTTQQSLPITTTEQQITTLQPTESPITESPFLNPKCGVSHIKPIEYAAKIVGGIESMPNSWPWQVLLSDGYYLCAAALLNNEWILTAAHCADMIPSRLEAVFGEHNINKIEGSEIKKSISKIIKHPFYNTTRNEYLWDYDIALMKLKTPVEYSKSISPICLPNGKIPSIGDVGIIVGWGDTKDNKDSGKDSKLKQTPITLNNLTVCYDKLSDRQLCAGDFKPIHDSCQGDSGGPFFVKSNGAYYVAGIVSASFDDCEGHGIYTSVPAFESWIYNEMNLN